jgi:hypothetical protein
MLPILPVLLLLLFSGPANIERLALEGRLPAAIEAVQRMDTPPSEREAYASLLAASKDPEFTRAIFALLTWAEPEEKPLSKPLQSGYVPIEIGESPPPQDGFNTSQRSRDGPLLVV